MSFSRLKLASALLVAGCAAMLMSISKPSAKASSEASPSKPESQEEAPGATTLSSTANLRPGVARILRFTLQDNLVRVGIEVNGRHMNAVLDSGTGAVMLDKKVPTQIGLAEKSTRIAALGGGSDVQQVQSVVLNDVNVGPLAFRNLTAYTADFSHLSSSAGFPIDALVGGPAFDHDTITVDYAGRQIIFDAQNNVARCTNPIRLELVHDVPVVEVELRPTPSSTPVRLRMMVDLGTRHTAAILGGTFLRSEAGEKMFRSGHVQQVGTGLNGAVKGVVAHVAELRVGRISFGSLDVTLTTGMKAQEMNIFDGTLGVPLWERGSISFDYSDRQLCIAV